ncbi:lipoprotein-releasing ABC transporter permease subunit LolE [Candidatus Tachikawaea gelatinosa]|uniref:Lipoprotein releasing system transmembrane protein n=1 Tax=Candidatus Tachikawaea gelatinosa TaxID=1410383 RepID=A0A090ARP4_9ENTR|nr:lipoprotein-releasing ABC transporter permease subunit LolE [Candidatus Tachikawaea gelatinosa]BAP58475.1 lipoprotein releasing system transmembrane protein [Candidatus Tachikawaea gelatinosa]
MTNILLSFNFAKRFIRGCHHRASLTSFISFIAVICVALGVAVLIITSSAVNGFEHELKERFLAIIPHEEIETTKKSFSNWEKIINIVKNVPNVQNATPYVKFVGLLEKNHKLKAIQLTGIDLKREKDSLLLKKLAINKDLVSQFKSGKKQIILGYGAAKTLNIKNNQWVTLVYQTNNDEKNMLLYPQYLQLKVIKILKLGGVLDSNLAIIPLEDAQNYLNMKKNSITGIALKMNNPFYAEKTTKQITQTINNTDFHIKNWTYTYGNIYKDIQIIRSIVYVGMILVISVASFNIVSTLIITIKKKNNDISILKILGAEDKLIALIFVWYAILIGLTGNIIGIIIGIITSLNLTTIFKIIENIIGFKFISNNIYCIDFLPSELHSTDIINVVIITIMLSLIASWYPSRQATLINPISLLKKK